MDTTSENPTNQSNYGTQTRSLYLKFIYVTMTKRSTFNKEKYYRLRTVKLIGKIREFAMLPL